MLETWTLVLFSTKCYALPMSNRVMVRLLENITLIFNVFKKEESITFK